MRGKRIIGVVSVTVILLLTLCLPLMAAEKVTLTTVSNMGGSVKFYNGDTREDNTFTRFLENEMGIVLKYQWIMAGKTGDFEQKLNLSIASGETPDMFELGNFDLYRKLARSGQLLDIGPLFEKYASPALKAELGIQDGILWDAVKVDGKIYGLPLPKFMLQDNKVLWVRQDWLDTLGLKAPTNVSEMYAVATAFTKKDPDRNGNDDTIGFAFDNSMASWMCSLDPFFGMFGSLPGTAYRGVWVDGPDDGLIYAPLLPGTKNALAELAKWYSEGIVNTDFVTQDAQAAAKLVGSGQVGMYFGSPWNPIWPQADTLKNVPGAEWKAYPLPDGPDGTHTFMDTPIVGAVRVFSSKFGHFDRVIDYFNYYVDGRAKLDAYEEKYALGHYFEKDEAGKLVPVAGREDQTMIGWNYPFKFVEMAEIYGKYGADVPFTGEIGLDIWREVVRCKELPEYGKAIQIALAEHGNATVNRAQALAPGPIHEKVWGFLTSLEQETFAKIIMGELPVSAYDEFVQKWKRAGGDKLATEVNEWYKSVR